MGKWVILSGMVVATIVIYRIQNDNLSVDQVFDFLETDVIESVKEEPKKDFLPLEKLLDKLKQGKKYQQEIYGMIFPADLELTREINKFFAKLQKKQKVEKFVILTDNNNTALNATKFIDKFFPEAETEVKIINDDFDIVTLEKLAKNLVKMANEKETIVLSITLFARQNETNVNKFHDELAENVILSMDIDSLDLVDVESKNSLWILFRYLELIGAQKAELISHFWDNVQTNFLVKFSKGEAVLDDRNLTILAFGDMMLGRNVRTLIDKYGDLNYIFEKIKGYEGNFFKGANVIFGNLEGPIKGAGRKGGTSMVFAFNEDVAAFLKASGFNLLSISNNHALDQGWDGRETTIAALDAAGLPWCGHPSESEKESVYFGEAGDKKFAFACFQDITHNLDQAKAVELIKDLRDEVDYLVVSIHWGVEYKHYPDNGLQIQPAHEFIDAGADFIIGHHPHVVQTFEIYKDKLIFYSLGNFVFDQYWSQDTQEELAIGIVLEDGKSYKNDSYGDENGLKTKVYLFPMRSDNSQSRLMAGEERIRWLEKFIGYGEYSEEIKEQIRNGVVEVP